jgi:hypothetical protein
MSPNGVLWTLSDDRGRLTERLAANGAGVLERNRVALLRHDAARLHEAVREPQVSEFRRAPQQQVLHDAPETCEQHGAGRHALEQIVHRRDAAVGVAGRPVETEQVAGEIAIDRKACAGDGARSERAAIGARIRGLQTPHVPLELLDRQPADSARSSSAAPAVCACAQRRRGAVSRCEVEQTGPQLQTDSISEARNSRCRIRYIVMSMSLRLRAVCSRPATSSPHERTRMRSM